MCIILSTAETSLGVMDSSLLFFFTLFTGPRRSLGLKLGDTRVYEPLIRARLGTTAHFQSEPYRVASLMKKCPIPRTTVEF